MQRYYFGVHCLASVDTILPPYIFISVITIPPADSPDADFPPKPQLTTEDRMRSLNRDPRRLEIDDETITHPSRLLLLARMSIIDE